VLHATPELAAAAAAKKSPKVIRKTRKVVLHATPALAAAADAKRKSPKPAKIKRVVKKATKPLPPPPPPPPPSSTPPPPAKTPIMVTTAPGLPPTPIELLPTPSPPRVPSPPVPAFVKAASHTELQERFVHLGTPGVTVTIANRKQREQEYVRALRDRYRKDVKAAVKTFKPPLTIGQKVQMLPPSSSAAAAAAAAPLPTPTLLPPSPIPLVSPTPPKTTTKRTPPPTHPPTPLASAASRSPKSSRKKTPPKRKTVRFVLPRTSPVTKTIKKQTAQRAKRPSMKANLVSYGTGGVAALLAMDQKALETMYRKANKTYREGEPIMTDTAFDLLEDHIGERFPTSKVLQVVGAKTKRVEVQLPYTLFSMNKIKPGQGKLAAWKAKHSGPYVISAKLDGASVLYELKADSARLLTHGEVRKGDTTQKGGDVSHLVPLIGLAEKLPASLPDTVMIRGEVILRRKVFEDKYSDDYANPRNLTAGLLNALDTAKHGDRQRDLELVAFEVIEPKGLTPSEQFAFLKQHEKALGLEVVQNEIIAKPAELTEERLSKEFMKLREDHPYECDGVIVADDKVYPRKNQNPDHAIAFKMTLKDEIVKATVRTVSWRVTKDGYIKPTVHLHPVKVPGATIAKATGHDAKKIRDRKIGPGAVVEVLRRGQVIPHLERVLTPATAAAVKESWWDGPQEWSETGVDIRLPAEARKDEQWNTEIRFSNLHRFFANIKAKHLGEKTMRKLFDSGYDTVKKLADATPQELTRVEGIQATSAKNIVESVKKALAEATAQQLMVGSNLFGRNTGNTISARVLALYPNILHFEAKDAAESRRLAGGLVTMIKGVSESRATQFVAAIPDFRHLIEPFRPELVAPWPLDKVLAAAAPAKKPSPVLKSHPLAGMEVITTGVKHNLIEPHLEKAGAKLGSRVNAQTAVVVIKDEPGYSSTKTQAAEKHNVPQMTVEQFMGKYFPGA